MNFKKSFLEQASTTQRAIVLGIGGGGDVIQCIPIANQLKLLGVAEVLIGGVGSSWWGSSDPKSSTIIGGPTVYDVHELSSSAVLAHQIVRVSNKSNYRGNQPAEALLADLLPGEVFVAGLCLGAKGLSKGLAELITARNIDLIVAVDVGSDSFHDGRETIPAHSSMIDFLTLSAVLQTDVPTIYALAGYGSDAEMQTEELDERVGRVMRAGGFLGATGPSQKDVHDMLCACELFPDPILPIGPLAARGYLGLHRIQTYSPWGSAIKVTPLTALTLFFDPRVLVKEVAIGVNAFRDTRSLEEAEHVYHENLGQFPETWLKREITFSTDRQFL